MRSFFIFLLVSFSSYYAGFSPDTIVFSSQGFIPIDQLQENSRIISYDLTTSTITKATVSNYRAYISSQTCRVICDNETSFVASSNQLVRIGKLWRPAKDLKSGDQLKCYNDSYAIVLSVEAWNNEQLLCEITVDPYHTFCITSRGIIAHNHPVAIFAVAPPVISVLSKIAIVGVISGALWSLFNKKKNRHKNHFIQESSPSGCSSPPPPKKPRDEDEFNKKHPHGRYEDAGYHKNHQSGRKSPRPINGQEALDNSFLIEDTSPRRIGVSRGQFVVLDRTMEGVYHGHVRTWNELTRGMQNILKNYGIVTARGKVI